MLTTGSHVHDIVTCLELVRKWKTTNPAHRVLADELEVHLCELMSSMLTSPLTGKMFAALPHEHLSPTEVEASLEAQTAV
jgi:hypothetical protein